MSRKLDGKVYLTIGEVAKLIGRGAQTIKSWLDWYSEQDDETKQKNPLPEPKLLDERGTRYFDESDIPMLEKFRDSIGYGSMAEHNRKRWGKRGDK
jgi:DNA-binding transcriptional MerR regulator